MDIYVANLGEQNIHWTTCLTEIVLTLETSSRLLDFWKRDDRDGWIDWQRHTSAWSTANWQYLRLHPGGSIWLQSSMKLPTTYGFIVTATIYSGRNLSPEKL